MQLSIGNRVVSNEDGLKTRPKVILSKKETEIVKLVGRGLQSKEIARLQNIKEAGVKFHLTSIYKKFKVKSRAELLIELRFYYENDVENILKDLVLLYTNADNIANKAEWDLVKRAKEALTYLELTGRTNKGNIETCLRKKSNSI